MSLTVVVPAAGEGQRLRPHTLIKPKVMLEVAGKPIIGHIIERLIALKPELICVVVPPEDKTIENYLQSNFSLPFKFVVQPVPKGLADAVLVAEDAVGDRPVLIILGDTILDFDLNTFTKEKNVIGVKEVTNPQRFGVVKLQNGLVHQVIEKPTEPVSNLAIVGIYFFSQPKPLYTALHQVIREGRMVKNEYQFTDALQILADGGINIKALPITNWYDCGTPEALLETNRVLLNQHQQEPLVVSNRGSIIIPPVSIAPDAVVEKSIIGPFVSLSAGVRIVNSIVVDALVYQNAVLKDTIVARGIVGESAQISGMKELLNIGPGEKIGQQAP